jgi:hypothetical protein
MSKSKKLTDTQIIHLVACLSDEKTWNWTKMTSKRDAADTVLYLMAQLNIIEYKEHPHGGNIWIFGNKIFGRTHDLPKEFAKYEIVEKKILPR